MNLNIKLNNSESRGTGIPTLSNAIKEQSAMIFINNKYTKWYYSIINNARNRVLTDYTEKHHIIPKSLGGNNTKDNLVTLSSREHFVCHLLLIKMTKDEDKKKMARALWLMAKGSNNRYKPSSKLYEVSRKSFVDAQKGHPTYLKSQTQHARNKISNTMKKLLSELTSEEKIQRMKNSCSSPASWTLKRKQNISRALTGKIILLKQKEKCLSNVFFYVQKE